MSFRIRNSWKYEGEDWWSWNAFLDDSGSGDLSNVSYVEYILHPTFPNPVVTISDSKDGFVLEASGWGTFLLKAFVHTKNGEKIKLTHELELPYDPQEGISK